MRAATLALWIALTSVAHANPEPPAYDARSVGLAGTGLAYLDSPAAIFHNPANLQGIDRFELSLALTTIVVDLQAPLAGPDSEDHTGWRFAPLPFFGLAVRAHEHVVLGLGAYVLTGYGGAYEDVTVVAGEPLPEPMDQDATLWVAEASLSAAFRITPALDVGLALRFPYARQRANVYQEIFEDTWRNVEQNVKGVGRMPGVLLGVTARPLPELSLALTYRSKVRIDMDGTTTVAIVEDRPIDVPSETSWSVPHALGFGVAYDAARWLITGELRFQMHREANKTQEFDLDFIGVQDITVPFEWKNVFSARWGGEFRFPNGAIRGGYNVSNFATSQRATQAFMPPPGIAHAVYAGGGIEVGPVNVDLALHYSWGGDTVEASPDRCQPGDQVKVGCAGEYRVRSTWLSLSMRYRLPN